MNQWRFDNERIRRMTEDPRTDFMTVPEVAEALKCSVLTVKRLVATGDLPSIKAGKLRRIRRSDLAAWPGNGE